MKRLGIFFFYEKNGDVDDFITYYLADLAKNLTDLVVVCNGKLSAQGRAAFSQFTDNIIVRENKGLVSGPTKRRMIPTAGISCRSLTRSS